MGDSVVAEEPLAVGVRVTEPLDVGVAVIEAVGVGVTGDPLAEGLAPGDRVAEGVPVLEGVPVGDAVRVGETVGELVGVAVDESEGGALLLAVLEELAPRVKRRWAMQTRCCCRLSWWRAWERVLPRMR